MSSQINIQITDATGKSFQFEELQVLLSFIKGEARYWKKQHESIASNKRLTHDYINNNFSELNELIETSYGSSEKQKQDEKGLVFFLRNRLDQIGQNWLWSGHSYSDMYAQCNKKYGKEAADTFFYCVIRNKLYEMKNLENYFGMIMAYEFSNQNSDIAKRSKSDKASLEHLRNEFVGIQSNLIKNVERFKQEFNSWDSETREKWKDQLKQYHEEFTSRMDDFENKIEELEETYHEKLRLDSPANYWKKAATKFKSEGNRWTLLLILSLLVGAIYFVEFFEWLPQQHFDVPQSIVIVGTILAVFGFLIRILSRLAFSSFHLMRDAEEREQLTHLYLSLVNEKTIDETSRDLILQALFSRSETGLITGESGPTMPAVSDVVYSALKPGGKK